MNIKNVYDTYNGKDNEYLLNHKCEIVKAIGNNNLDILHQMVARAIYEFGADNDFDADYFIAHITNTSLIRWLFNN